MKRTHLYSGLILLASVLFEAYAPSYAFSADTPNAATFEISQFQIEGDSILGKETLDSILEPYTGKLRSFPDLEHARKSLQNAYFDAGYGAVHVQLPEQEIKNGVVKFKVIEARIHSVKISGNNYFDNENIRASLPGLKEGQSPNTRHTANSLSLANENPSKQTTLVMKTGEKPGDVDAVIRVEDEKTWKAFVTLDNTGNTPTGQSRLGVGYQNTNVGNRDQILTMQYTTSPEKMSDVSIYGLSYRLPLYALGDSLDFFGGYSDVNSGKIAGVFDVNVSGKGTVLGMRYNQYLPKLDTYQHKLSYGLDYRAFKSSVDYQGMQLGNDVTVHPVSLGYSGEWHLPKADLGMYVTLIKNISGGSKGHDADFEIARTGARADYELTRYGFNLSRSVFDEWQFRAVFDGQYTSEPLIPGEQFGLGGMDSVRGFDEREVSNDKGTHASFELYTPNFGNGLGLDDGSLRAVLFYDLGQTSRNNIQPGDTAKSSIASVGIGMRYALGKQLSARLDYAHVVDAGGSQGKGDERLHASFALLF